MKYSEHGFISPTKRKIDFIDYCNSFLDSYPNTDKRIVKYAIKYFIEFIREIKEIKQLLPSDVTEDLIMEYKKYLDNKLNGESPYNYFTKFKKFANKLQKIEYFLQTQPLILLTKEKTA